MPGPRANDISPRVAGVIVALAAIAVIITRALYLSLSTNGPLSAIAIEQVFTFLRTGTSEVDPLATWTPIYTRIAALITLAIDLIGPRSPLEGCRWACILMTAASVVPLYWIARVVLGSRLSGVTAVALYVVMPLTWWFSGEMLPDAAGIAWLLWPFGLLARWWHADQPRFVGLACLLMGAAPLVHFGTGVLFLPLFVLVVAVGAPTRGLWRSVRLLPLIALIPGATYALAAIAGDVPGPVALLKSITPRHLFGSDLNGPNDASLRFMLEMALGSVAYWVSGVGAAALLIARPRAFPWVVLWAATVLVPQLLAAQTAIRLYLPVMPVAAVLLAAIPTLLARWRVTRPVGIAAAVAVIVFTAGYARRDLITLSTRYNVMDAICAWYKDHTPARSLLLAGIDSDHVAAFGGSRKVLTAPTFKEHKAHADWTTRVRTPIELVGQIDAWLLSGGEVYTHDWLALESVHALNSHYELEKVGELKLDNLRNFRDPEFGWMGEGLKITKPLSFFKLTMRKRLPRSAPAPTAQWRIVADELHLVATVHVPHEPGAKCQLWVSGREDALDWTMPGFARDPLLQATSDKDNEDTTFDLNHAGQGGIDYTLELDGSIDHPLWVAYAVVDSDGALRRISAATEVPKPPVPPRGRP